MRLTSILFATLLVLASAAEAKAQKQATIRDYRFTIETEFAAGSVRLSRTERTEMKRLVYEQLGYYLQEIHQSGIGAFPGDIIVKSAITVSRTDASGTAAKNQEVSQKRANGLDANMREIVSSLGIRFSPEVFFAMGVGEDESNENECYPEMQYCSNQPQYTLPWDQPCVKEVLVCPAYQRRSTIEVILQYSPAAITPPPVDDKIITQPLPDITPEEKPVPPSSIEELPPATDSDSIIEPVPEKKDPTQPLPVPEDSNTVTPPEEKTPETDTPAEPEKKGPNKLKVYGNDIEG